jgi:hypothetical protein
VDYLPVPDFQPAEKTIPIYRHKKRGRFGPVNGMRLEYPKKIANI